MSAKGKKPRQQLGDGGELKLLRSGRTMHDSLKKSELRCVKYSPSVRPSNYCPSLEAQECEANLWDATFATMGRLKAMGMEDVKTFTILNKQPYHCAIQARTFDAAYGPLARVGHIPKADTSKKSYKAAKKENTMPVVGFPSLPRTGNKPSDPNAVPRHLFTGQKPMDEPYLPPTAVRVRWGDTVTENRDLLCEWLAKKFGPIGVVIPESDSQCIVVFREIRSSYNAVNAGIPRASLNINWYEPRFNNFGHYSVYKKYTLTKDDFWNKAIDVFKSRATLKSSLSLFG